MEPDLELPSTSAVVEVSAADANYGGVGTYHLVQSKVFVFGNAYNVVLARKPVAPFDISC
jgi:hypothetical protein